MQAEAFADYAMGKKGLVLPKSAQTLFDKILAFFERLGNFLRGLGYKSAEDIFEKTAEGKIRERYVRQPARSAPAAEKAAAFRLEGTIRRMINTLKSPDLPIRAEQDKGFKDSIRKNRLGLVKITDKDLKIWERVLSLPFWLHDKYPELKPMIHTQMKREESRAETIHGLLNRARPFFDLKGEELARVERALVQGDREGKVYEDKELREKFHLSGEGIKGYRSVRATLDWIHREWKDRIEENLLREYEKAKWFVLFKAAHGLDFTDEETLALDKALKKTHRAMEKPVETVRAHLQRVFEEELSHQNKRLLADLLGDYIFAYRRARKQIDKIKAMVREAIGEGMSEEELNQNTQELVQAYIRSLPAMQQLKEMRSELNRLKGYFPRSRKAGKYRVVVLDKFTDSFGNEEKVTLFYENAANCIEATKIYDKIKADPQNKDMEILVEANRQEPGTSFMGASAINMQRLVDNAIDKVKTQGTVEPEIANLIRMNVLETLADELKARGAGRFSIKRAGNVIEGYQKTNLKEVLKDYLDGWSGMITKQEAALEFLEELKGIPRSKPQLMGYASKYAQDMLRNQEPMDRISAKMRSLAFVYFLGGSLRAALVNFTQNYVTGIPFLAREVGAKSLKAEKLYHKAMFDVAMGRNLNDIEKRMLDEMINKGVAEDQFIRQITREVKGGVGKTVGQVTDILAKPFSWMEKLNRKSAALAMFREKYRSYLSDTHTDTDTLSEEAYRRAFDDAQDFVYKTHYLMTKANLPSITAGGDIGAQFLKTAYTFRRFTHNYLLSLHHSLKGEDGKLALDVMGRSLAYVALLAGIPALPFLDDLLDEWEKFFGTPVRSNMRKTMWEIGGPVLEKMGMAGIPALMGIDISGSLKIGVPLAGAGGAQDTIYGVYGGLARKSLNAMRAVEREDYLRAMEFASPAFIEAILKAYRMSETGVTTPRGKIITDEQGKPIRLETGEGVAQAAGFRPERLARVSGEHWTMENVQAHFREKRDDLYSRYRLAKTSEEKRRVIQDMQKLNLEARKHRGVIPPITASSLRQAAFQKPEKPFIGFGRMMEASP